MDCNSLRIASVVSDSIVDGPGLRYSIYVQGCPIRCEGCHNAQTWDFIGGEEVPVSKIIAEIEKNTLLDGITLTGGDPFSQAVPLIEIARFARSRGLNVWVWSGWTYEELINGCAPYAAELLEMCDVLVDGRFILAERTLALEWRGSPNQRIIDLVKTRERGEVTLYEAPVYGGTLFTEPPKI